MLLVLCYIMVYCIIVSYTMWHDTMFRTAIQAIWHLEWGGVGRTPLSLKTENPEPVPL